MDYRDRTSDLRLANSARAPPGVASGRRYSLNASIWTTSAPAAAAVELAALLISVAAVAIAGFCSVRRRSAPPLPAMCLGAGFRHRPTRPRQLRARDPAVAVRCSHEHLPGLEGVERTQVAAHHTGIRKDSLDVELRVVVRVEGLAEVAGRA
jgi:hypothetical protein